MQNSALRVFPRTIKTHCHMNFVTIRHQNADKHLSIFDASHLQLIPSLHHLSRALLTMTLLLHPRPQAGSSSLLSGMLESPLEFGPPLHRSAVVATRGAREVIMGPRSPLRRPITVNGTPSRLPNGHLGEPNGNVPSNAGSDPIEPSSSRTSVGTPTSTPTRKGKEPATAAHLPAVDLSWPTRIAQTQKSGAGLYNPSMACYANATLQVMLHTPPVLARAMSHKAEDCE